MKKAFLILSFSILLLPLIASAITLNLDYPSFGGIDINKDDEDCCQSLGKIVAWFYYLIVGISGLAAFAMLVFGGIQWLSSAGNPGRISDAKSRIQNALLGLLLILGSFLILQIINPELTILKTPGLQDLDPTPEGISIFSGGECPSLNTISEECGVQKLEQAGWGNLAQSASYICQKESGGNPKALNASCLWGGSCDFSGGLFQFRAMNWCEGRGIRIDRESPPNDTGVILCTCTVYNTQALNFCLAERGIGNISIIRDPRLGTIGAIITTDGDPNLQRSLAKTIWYNDQGWSAWACSARECGLISGPTCTW